jgi:hypothetical protein
MYMFIDAMGGTGGGIFRYMFSRFLREAAKITGETGLYESADEFRTIGDQWEKLGHWFQQTSEAPNPASQLGECVAPFYALADLEGAAWTRLCQLVD